MVKQPAQSHSASKEGHWKGDPELLGAQNPCPSVTAVHSLSLILTSYGYGVRGTVLSEQPPPRQGAQCDFRARRAAIPRQHATHQHSGTEIKVCKVQPDNSKDCRVFLTGTERLEKGSAVNNGRSQVPGDTPLPGREESWLRPLTRSWLSGP